MEGPRVSYKGTGFYASVIVAVLVTAALLVFAVQNTATITVEWLFFDITGPVFAFVIGAALLAVVLDEIVGLIWRSRERNRLNRTHDTRRHDEDRSDDNEKVPSESTEELRDTETARSA